MRTGSAIIRVTLVGVVAIGLCLSCRQVHKEQSVTGIIEGVVTDSASGAPVVGASVLLKGSRMGCTTDEKGHFEVRKIPFGQYTIVVSSVYHQAVEISGLNVFQMTPVTVTARMVEKHVTLDSTITVSTDDGRWTQPPGHIRGIVEDSVTGNPLIGASVIVKGTKLGATTDIEGKFEIRGVTPGVGSLVVTMVGYVGKTINDVTVREHKTTKVKIKLGTKRKQAGTIRLNGDGSQ